MKTSEVVSAWRKILRGERPSLSIEITRECPLQCPGCYAYDDAHLGGGATLRSLADRKGQELIDGVLALVDRIRPLHLSIVGGDPLVRYRELETMIPLLLNRGIHVQVVTSAFRPLAASWAELPHMNVVVSIDGLQPEHDIRRAPATYDRILKNIAGQNITIHCTITGQMMKRPGYLREFLEFWAPRPEIRKIWFSLFTPQRGDQLPEMLEPQERAQAIADMLALRKRVPQAGHAGGHDPPVCDASVEPSRLCLRADHADFVGGLENQDRALSIRRRPGLQFVRMRRFHGAGRRGRAPAGRDHPRGSDLQSFDQDRPGPL